MKWEKVTEGCWDIQSRYVGSIRFLACEEGCDCRVQQGVFESVSTCIDINHVG
jgi:hypothetical protein